MRVDEATERLLLQYYRLRVSFILTAIALGLSGVSQLYTAVFGPSLIKSWIYAVLILWLALRMLLNVANWRREDRERA